MTLESYDLIIVGAGASGIGCAVMAKEFGVQPGRTLIIERGNAVGSTFEEWPLEMRFITPSFNQQAFGFMDLNSVAFDTSPAQLLHVQHPTGPQYAKYLCEVARIHALPVVCSTSVTRIDPVAGGFELSIMQSPNAATKLPVKIRTKFAILATGEFQYPKTGGLRGAAEHCLHNSRVQSWATLAQQQREPDQPDNIGQERVIIGGYESGMDAAVHLTNAGVNVTVMASTPFWSTRTLDPSTELAPFTAERIKVALAGENPPKLMSNCRVISVQKEPLGSEYVITAERTKSAADEDIDGGEGGENTDLQPTVIVRPSCDIDSGKGNESDSESDSSGSDPGSESDSDGADSEGSDSKMDSQDAVQVNVDQNERVVAQTTAELYRFRSFSTIVSQDTTRLVREDCCIVARSMEKNQSHDEDVFEHSFWIGANDEPRCGLEQAALDIFRFHTGIEGCSFDTATSGAEWRPLRLGTGPCTSASAWHWNSDCTLQQQSGINISPHLSTITHLCDDGPPLVVIGKTRSIHHRADISGQAHEALLSRPQSGKHVVFDGRYIYAAPTALSLWAASGEPVDGSLDDGTRSLQKDSDQHVSLVVNIWLNWKPSAVMRCPDAVLTELSTAAVPLCFSQELAPIPTVPSPAVDPGQRIPATNVASAKGGGSEGAQGCMETIEWQFEDEKQLATMSFTAPLDSIRRMGAQTGASVIMRSWAEPKARADSIMDEDGPTIAETAPEIIQVRTRSKPILATGFHSGVAQTFNNLFEWTAESLCDGNKLSSGERSKHDSNARATEENDDDTALQNSARLVDAEIPSGDPKLTECDESTRFPGLFLCGPQVRQDNQIFCFVYKYRQRFAVVMNEIATRLGLQTQTTVAKCRKHHMFLDDTSGCEPTCGSACETPPESRLEMVSDWPLVQVEAQPMPKSLKPSVAKDIRSRGQLVNKAQNDLASAITNNDLRKVAKLLDAGLAKLQRTTLFKLDLQEAERPKPIHCAPLHIAVDSRKTEVAELLLRRGADPNFTAYTRKQLTPLMVAVLKGPEGIELVDLLIQNGADVNQVGPNGATAFHFACDIGIEQSVLALVHAGCDQQVMDAAGMTGREVADSNENTAVVCALDAAVPTKTTKKASTTSSSTPGGKTKRKYGCDQRERNLRQKS